MRCRCLPCTISCVQCTACTSTEWCTATCSPSTLAGSMSSSSGSCWAWPPGPTLAPPAPPTPPTPSATPPPRSPPHLPSPNRSCLLYSWACAAAEKEDCPCCWWHGCMLSVVLMHVAYSQVFWAVEHRQVFCFRFDQQRRICARRETVGCGCAGGAG